MANIKEILYICNIVDKNDNKRRAYKIEEYNELKGYLTEEETEDDIETRLFPTVITGEIEKFLNSNKETTNVYKLLQSYYANCKNTSDTPDTSICRSNYFATNTFLKTTPMVAGKGKINKRKQKGGGNTFRILRFIFSCMADPEMNSTRVAPSPTDRINIVLNVDTHNVNTVVNVVDGNEIEIGFVEVNNTNNTDDDEIYNGTKVEANLLMQHDPNLPKPIIVIEPNGEILIGKLETLHPYYTQIGNIGVATPFNALKQNRLINFIKQPPKAVLQLQIPIDISKHYEGIFVPYFIYILLFTMNADARIEYSKLPVIMDARFDTTQTIYVLEYKKEYNYNVFSKYKSEEQEQKQEHGFDLKYLVFKNQENQIKMRVEYMSNIPSETPEASPIGILYSLMKEIKSPILYDDPDIKTHFFRSTMFCNNLTNLGIYNQVAGTGKSSSQKLKEYITILGRKRLIHKQGRSKFIKYQGSLIKVKDAKILDKKTKK